MWLIDQESLQQSAHVVRVTMVSFSILIYLPSHIYSTVVIGSLRRYIPVGTLCSSLKRTSVALAEYSGILLVRCLKILLITVLLNPAKVFGIWIDPQSTNNSTPIIVQIDTNERTLYYESNFVCRLKIFSFQYTLILNSGCGSSFDKFSGFVGFSIANT